MAKTPEGLVKDDVRAFLHEQGCARAGDTENKWPTTVKGWYYMASQNGLGVSGIHDFVGCLHGRMFMIETKARGKLTKVTSNQQDRGDELERGGGKAFYIDDVDALREQWYWWVASWSQDSWSQANT